MQVCWNSVLLHHIQGCLAKQGTFFPCCSATGGGAGGAAVGPGGFETSRAQAYAAAQEAASQRLIYCDLQASELRDFYRPDVQSEDKGMW